MRLLANFSWALAVGSSLLGAPHFAAVASVPKIVGMSLIVPVANTILQVRNPAANASVLTMAPFAGGASPVSAHLTILRLQ